MTNEDEEFSGGDNDRIAKQIKTMNEEQIAELQDQFDMVNNSPIEPGRMTKARVKGLYPRTWERLNELGKK